MKNLSNKEIQITLVEEVLTKPTSNPSLLKKYLQNAAQSKDALAKIFDKIYDTNAPSPQVSNRPQGPRGK